MGKKPAVHGGGMGFGPWPGKIPRATEQLSPRAPTTEPAAATAEACTLWGP